MMNNVKKIRIMKISDVLKKQDKTVAEIIKKENAAMSRKCLREAMGVDFLSDSDEVLRYAKALYGSMLWGREVNSGERRRTWN